jgi:hypothetical protein
MSTNLPADYNPTMRLSAKAARPLPPDMIRRRVGDEVEISVRDFFLACNPTPEELAEVDRKRKELGLKPLYEDDV